MFSFVWRGEELVAFYLGEAKHVICSVSNLGESEFCPTLDIVYPTTHAPGALLIASRMKEIGGMPTAFINSNTNTHTRVISVTLALNVELEFLMQVHPPLRQLEKQFRAEEIRLIMGAFATTEERFAEPFLSKFMDQGFFKLAVGAPHLPVKMRESLASTDLRCYKDGKPDPEYTKTIH